MAIGKREPGGGYGNGQAAVVSDGSALRDSGAALDPVVGEFAAHIGELARIPVRPVTVAAADSAELAERVRALPADVGAVLLTHAEPARTRAAQDALRAGGARPIVTDQDATAIAVSAALLSALTGRGRRPDDLFRGQVVIAGARELPILAPLLVAAGVVDITLWNRADAASIPLRTIVSGARAVIDLVGGVRALAEDEPRTTVITRGDAHTAPWAAAGLLRAALLDPGVTFDVETYHACALALHPPPGATWPVPHGNAQALTRRVADAVARLSGTRPRPH